MALSMTRPTKHPKTGTFLVRLAIPTDLRETTKRLFGLQAELRENLKTKDSAEARRRAPAAVARLRAKLDRARATASEAPSSPTSREVAALAGQFYRRRVGAGGDAAAQDLHWEVALELFSRDPLVAGPDDPDQMEFVPNSINEGRAERLLEEHGFSTDPDSVQRLATALVRADRAFVKLLKRRMDGDWSPDPNLTTFPELTVGSSSANSTALRCSFDDLLSGWARDHGFDLTAKPIARAAYDRKRTLERLASFLGHRDAEKVSRADAVRWKESMQDKALAIATIRNDLSEMSAIWRWGVRNGKLGANRSKASPRRRSAGRGGSAAHSQRPKQSRS